MSGTSSQAHKNDSLTYFMGSEGRFFFTGRKTSRKTAAHTYPPAPAKPNPPANPERADEVICQNIENAGSGH